MKKILTILFLVLIFSILNVPLKVFAQGASGTPQQINARILPLVWYSTLSINDGDSIKIYAGIQNNSGVNFTGVATFFVDDKEISNSPFSSMAGSLKDVSTNWVANPGSHSVQVKIVTSLSSDKTLVSSESDKSSINITQKVVPTVPITPEIIGTTVLNTASDIIGKTDNLANVLADNIETLKKPVDNSASGNVVATTTAPKKIGSVLGASTSPAPSADTNTSSTTKMYYSVFNMVMDALAFLVRNWMWSLGGIILLLLWIKF